MGDEQKTVILTFQLVDKEIEDFTAAFVLSGFRSKSEFIRFCLFQGIKELYGTK